VLDVGEAERICALGRAAGLDAVGIAAASPFESTRRDLEARKAEGLHGGMAFTYRNPARSTTPSQSVPGAQALVVGARSYRRAEPEAPNAPAGRVARYSWVDHYEPLREALGAVAAELRRLGWRALVAADDNRLVDREAAYRAGLGWYGKNANLLLPGQGSWFVLGAVITDAPLPPSPGPVADGCRSCRRCLDACPTAAIVAPGVVDARRCLAWLVQQAGVFPRELRAALGDRLYGCDECQEVCPPNQRAEHRAPAPAPEDAAEAWVPLVELLRSTDAELLARHGRWYVPKREPRWLRRNALVVLGNVGDGRSPEVEAALRAALEHPDPMLRAHAAWAADRLDRRDLVAVLEGDPAADVVEELAALAVRPG
jgi:epoxyqueuosine reductase